jgi:hydroxylaminobenzene mutase
MNDNVQQPDLGRKLMQLGVVLFLLGLLTGFAVPLLELPRVGLTSHLEGVLNGILLLVLGLVWPHLRLSARMTTLAYWLIVYAAFANWFATLMSAVTGAGGTLPLASAGRVGAPAAEIIVGLLLITLSFAMVGACVLLIRGLRGVAR